MEEPWSTLLAVLGGGAGVVAIGGGVGRWVFDRAAERMSQRLSHDYERALEGLRAEHAREAALLQAAATALHAGNESTLRRRTEAIEAAWKAMMDVKASLGVAVFFYDLHLFEEYNTERTYERFAGVREEALSKVTERTHRPVELLRPFLGERMWSYWWLYQALYGRTYLILAQGIAKRQIPRWRDDPVVRQLIGIALSDAELKAIAKQDATDMGYVQGVLNAVEMKVLGEANRILSGSAAAEAALAEGQRMAKQIAAVALSRVPDSR